MVNFRGPRGSAPNCIRMAWSRHLVINYYGTVKNWPAGHVACWHLYLYLTVTFISIDPKQKKTRTGGAECSNSDVTFQPPIPSIVCTAKRSVSRCCDQQTVPNKLRGSLGDSKFSSACVYFFFFWSIDMNVTVKYK